MKPGIWSGFQRNSRLKRRPQAARLFLNPGVRPGIQFTCRSYLYNIETGSKLGVKKPIQQVGFYERALRAGESCSLALTLSAHSAGIRIVTYGPASAKNQILVDSGLRPGIKKGISDSAESDQVPPGLASLRGWIAPGLRPGPILACGRDWCGGYRYRF